MSLPSYWLKFNRAAGHFEEIKGLVAPYEEVRPYMVTHTIEGKNKDHVYRTYPAVEPDPWIAVVLGDFLFNLRSALDHLRVALVPRKRRYKGYFPIFLTDIWARDPATGEYSEQTAGHRQLWESSVRGMAQEAAAEIDRIQPFRFPDDQIPHLTLAILNRLNNADKHRELVVVSGLMTLEGGVIHLPEGPKPFVATNPKRGAGGPGAEITRLDRKVKVEARGGIVVTIGAGKHAGPGGYGLPETCETMFNYIGAVIETLEDFVVE